MIAKNASSEVSDRAGGDSTPSAPRVIRRCSPEYSPSAEWGSGTQVQWGGRGMVVGSGGEGSYRTAFFEAFPASGSGYIRGEGGTVAEAESNALLKRRRELSCTGHQWSRRGYTNGLCFCRVCGCAQSAMPAIVKLGKFRRPASASFIASALQGDNETDLEFRRRNDLWNDPDRAEFLRLRRAGIDLPERDGLSSEAFHAAFGKACRAWALTGKADRFIEEVRNHGREGGALDAIFARLEIEELVEAIVEVRESPDQKADPSGGTPGEYSGAEL